MLTAVLKHFYAVSNSPEGGDVKLRINYQAS